LSPRFPLAGLVLGTSILFAGCGNPAPTLPPASVPATPPGSASPTSVARPTPTEPLNGQSVPPIGVEPDPSLLDLVPASQAGATLTYDPETTASVAADKTLGKSISYLAIGLARPVGAVATDPDFAIVNVARPRDQNAVNDDWFRDWRDSYDTPACAQAGGVARHSQTEVAGLTIFTAACANGAFTYHALIADGGIVLSITSIGPANLGRTIVENLHR
jgi:hypothetical protein